MVSKKIYLLLTFLLLTTVSFGQTIGKQGDLIEDVTAGAPTNVQYFIVSPGINNVYTCSVRPKAGATGEVTIPKEIEDKTYHKWQVVTAERFGGSKLTKITFPEGLTSFADGCFSRCGSLQEINIPSTVTNIGTESFFECSKLTTINVADGNQNYKSEDGMLLSKDGLNLYYYFARNTATEFSIPSTVTHIFRGAFSSNPNLVTLNIPSSVTTIDIPAIYYNKAQTDINVDAANPNYSSVNGILTSKDKTKILTFPYHKGEFVDGKQTYTIPEGQGITTIGSSAFLYCEELNSISIAEGITTIEIQAFFSCRDLTELTLPSTLTAIEGDPFARCNNLEAFHVKEGNTEYGDIDGVLTNSDKTQIIKYPLKKNRDNNGNVAYDIPASVEEIGSNAFSGVNLTTLTIPNTVKTLGTSAFSSCARLQSVTFEPTCQITEIPNNVFSSCGALTSITIPSSVTKIDGGAFYRDGLTNVTVEGTSLTEIGAMAFSQNNSLATFTIDENSPLTLIGKQAFSNTALTTFTCPKALTILGNAAFSDNKLLATVIFAGDNLTKIGNNSFQNCVKLTDVNIPSSVTAIGDHAFDTCSSLTEVTIPAATTSIGTQSFVFCDKLQNIHVAAGNTKFADVDGMLTTGGSDNKEELYTMPAGRANSEYTLLPTIKTIGSEACYWNKNLTNIDIPSSVTTIKANAFYGCDKLKNVACLGEDAPVVESGAFSHALTNDAVLYYRKRAADKFAGWKDYGFATLHPSFNDAYKDTEAGRAANSKDLVEYIPLSDNTVAIVDNASVDGTYPVSQKTTLIIPAKVSDTFEGNATSYDVRVVYDYAFTHNANLHTITFFAPIEYIGVNAFYKEGNGGRVADIYFPDGIASNLAFAQDKYNMDNTWTAFADGQKVYVKKSELDAAKALLSTDIHPCDVEYKIPVTAGASSPFGQHLATFCREFPADFSEGTFVPYVTEADSYKSVDGQTAYTGIIKATSVDNGLVPAWTGVILSNEDRNNAPSFYKIAETTPDASTESMMKGLYEDTDVKASVDGKTSFGMKSGVFHPYSQDGTVNAFHAYLSMALPASGAKISVRFVDNQTTGIDAVSNVSEQVATAAFYDLSGRKVADNWQKAHATLAPGIYLVNGKKIMVRKL